MRNAHYEKETPGFEAGVEGGAQGATGRGALGSTETRSHDESKSTKADEKWEKVQRILDACFPIDRPDSGPAKYLAGRGIDINKLAENILGRARGGGFGPHGALVATLTDDAGTVWGVQSVYVKHDGSKAPETKDYPQKRLNCHSDWYGKACFRLPRTNGTHNPLVVCEGVEDALSIWQSTGDEVWASCGIEHMHALPVPKDSTVIIARDADDPDSPANQSVNNAIAAFQRRGCTVLVATPPEGFKDANELLVNSGPDAVREYVYNNVYAPKVVATSTRRAVQHPTATGNTVQWRDFTDKYCTRPSASLRNTVIAINTLGIENRLDLFHSKTLVAYRGETASVKTLVGELTDNTLGGIRSLIDTTYGFDPGDANVFAAVREIACANAFDPVVNYLGECEGKWDSEARIDALLPKYFGAADTPLNRAIGSLSLIQSVARARNPGCKVDEITVLEGPEGLEKSTAIETLYGKENFSDQSILAASDREAQELVGGVWGYEIADLTGISRADADRVKAFASRNTDRARKAYGRVREDVKRRCKFWGTTNDDDYLLSPNGNRRFWPVQVGRVDIVQLRNDRDQLWGEAAARYSKGASIRLDSSLWPTAAEEQDQRRQADPWEEILTDIPETVVLEPGTPGQHVVRVLWKAGGQERVASGTLLTYVLRIPPAQQNGSHGKRLKQAMQRLGWQRHKDRKVFIDNRSVAGFWRPDYADPAVQKQLALGYVGAST